MGGDEKLEKPVGQDFKQVETGSNWKVSFSLDIESSMLNISLNIERRGFGRRKTS